MAEKERFELSLRLTRTTPLAGAPLRPLEYFSVHTNSRYLHSCYIIIAISDRFVKRFWENSFILMKKFD